MSGADALKRAGLKPLELGPKEGVALINGTQVMTAIGCLALYGLGTLAFGKPTGAIAAFLVMNMRFPWQPRAKVFMGNAGSALLGLTIAWASFRLPAASRRRRSPSSPRSPYRAPGGPLPRGPASSPA